MRCASCGRPGKPIVHVDRDVGIHHATLGNWVQQDKRTRGEAATVGGLGQDEWAELARLRRENAEPSDSMIMEAATPASHHPRCLHSRRSPDRSVASTDVVYDLSVLGVLSR
jgi:transposase-like protein